MERTTHQPSKYKKMWLNSTDREGNEIKKCEKTNLVYRTVHPEPAARICVEFYRKLFEYRQACWTQEKHLTNEKQVNTFKRTNQMHQ